MASWSGLFPTLAEGSFDFKVYVVLAPRPEPDWSARWQRIPAVPSRRVSSMPNHQVSLQCPTSKYPCSTQPPSIPAVPSPTAEYPCSAQTHSIFAVLVATYSCSAQTHSIFAVLKGKMFLCCPTLAMPNPTAFAFAGPKCNIVAVHLQCCKEDRFLGEQGSQGMPSLYGRTKEWVVVQLPANNVGRILSPCFGW